MDPVAESARMVGAVFHYSKHRSDYGADGVTIAFVLAIAMLAGFLLEGFWPRQRFRPTYTGGAILGLVQAVIYSAFALYGCYTVLRLGRTVCLVARRCGGYFYGPDGEFFTPSDRMVSMGAQPFAYWVSYFPLFCATVVFIAWAFVCVRALRQSS